MSLKKITSLTMLLAMVVMTFTGIMLFIAPPGRVANWANWELAFLSKEQYSSLHSTMMVLFIVATILHLFYNWKPITSYMKNQSKKMVILTKDMMVAFLITAIFIVGTLSFKVPFSSFLEFGDGIKNSWEKTYGTAPYSHAELSSFENFCKKLGFDIFKAEEILETNNINFEATWSLSQIAKENGVSPQFIFDLLRKNFEKDGQKIIPLTGLGKKTIEELAFTLGLKSEEFIKKLESLGIKAEPEEKFKDIAESYDMSPMDILGKLGFKKPE